MKTIKLIYGLAVTISIAACSPNHKTAKHLGNGRPALKVSSKNIQCMPDKNNRTELSSEHVLDDVHVTIKNTDSYQDQCDGKSKLIETIVGTDSFRVANTLAFTNVLLQNRQTCKSTESKSSFLSSLFLPGVYSEKINISQEEKQDHLLVVEGENIIDYELYKDDEVVGTGQIRLNVSTKTKKTNKPRAYSCFKK